MQVQVELPDSVNVDPGYVREALMAVLYTFEHQGLSRASSENDPVL
jgi:hypothetical protein